LDQLEEHYRLVLTLYYFDDMKYNDIADILDIPLNTVKSHIRRGKERLAALLVADEQPPAQPNVSQAAQSRADAQRNTRTIAAPIRLLNRFAGG
jgi:RNA polymerase sigma-70 factor (ECF subfamily)